MKLIPFHTSHMKEMMSWFSDSQQIHEWGGPAFRYPFTEDSFCSDLRLMDLESFRLFETPNQLLGFGQFYINLDRVHIGRIVISPGLRRRGLGRELIIRLIQLGKEKHGAVECSLYVSRRNLPALKCYDSLGFTESEAPEHDPSLPDCIFMTRPI